MFFCQKTVQFCQIGKVEAFFPEFGKEGFYFPESGKVEFIISGPSSNTIVLVAIDTGDDGECAHLLGLGFQCSFVLLETCPLQKQREKL